MEEIFAFCEIRREFSRTLVIVDIALGANFCSHFTPEKISLIDYS